jgi:hypothetical protein
MIDFFISKRRYKIVGKNEKIKFELEIVYIEELGVLGIRRKRVRGDSWTYKRMMDQVLALSIGASSAEPAIPGTPTPRTPLQTMV